MFEQAFNAYAIFGGQITCDVGPFRAVATLHYDCEPCLQCDGAGRRGITIKIHGDARIMKNAARLIATDRTLEGDAA